MIAARTVQLAPPGTRALYTATALYVYVDSVELTERVAYEKWSSDAVLATRLACPVLALNPLDYHLAVLPPEAAVQGQSLVRAVPDCLAYPRRPADAPTFVGSAFASLSNHHRC